MKNDEHNNVMHHEHAGHEHPLHHEHSQDIHSGHGNENKYYCPMKCEGEKTYDEPGNCPVCNMHLVPVEDDNSENKMEHHKNQVHHHEEGVRHSDHREPMANNPKKDQYYCPMRCEGEKVYDAPGDCPVCGMHLRKVESRPSKPGGGKVYTCP